ncbi:DeoR family transcriptional regulator [Pseudomonas syringae]|uniref:diguanylate cyclase n=1 Tax=Pseudomonas syringae TaxID=317 RepID=A0A1C7Z298_PSESX|nr:GGDEF domain-containing protein [Pseudomonas syringae]OCR23539.1 DeoR family transcriptional regulator [Pseudomonas syringae]
MSDDAERWKEKYLTGIEQQEKLERRWEARLDLLRRGLVRSSLAAEGSDRAVDQCMKEMREIVRKDDMDAGLAALIPRLEKAVLDSEQRREVRAGQISSALTALVTQLQSLPLPKDVRKPLKKFAKDLEERASQSRELPLLLGELSGLQGQALTLMDKPEEAARPGLLQRLFGGHESPNDVAPAPEHIQHPATEHYQPKQNQQVEPLAAAPDHVPTSESEPEPEPVVVPTQHQPDETDDSPQAPIAEALPPVVAEVFEPAAESPVQPVQLDAAEPLREPPIPVAAVAVDAFAVEDLLTPTPSVPFEQLPEAVVEAPSEEEGESETDEQALDEEGVGFALPASPEPSYSSVAAHIEQTLLGLLNDLTLPEHHRPQAEAMRKRLEHGLNWYELLPILDDLAVLMLAITDTGQHEFEIYLKQLNERLESFQSNLQAASAGYADNQSVSRDLNSQLREQVDGLQSSVQDAPDLSSLKRVLENRLEGLLNTMDQHQVQRDAREHEVAERLQSLATRVATMEQEALGFRGHLEEQRQKALIDPLTSLPNRAAWGERLEQEMAAWQQQKNSLLVCMLDLDHFKRINDGFGHLAGDRVLKIIATVLKKRLRSSDFIARFGGEEFVLLLPATAVSAGLALLDELRAAVELCPFHFKSEPVTVTVSMGVTAFRAGERSDVALKRADQALYRAKENGRNRIEQG